MHEGAENTCSTYGKGDNENNGVTELERECSPLNSDFTFWVHNKLVKQNTRKRSGNKTKRTKRKAETFKASINELATFNTVEKFWFYFQYVPLPSSLFFTGLTNINDHQNKQIEGLSIFRQGIKPTWEDVANKDGGEFFFRFKSNKTYIFDFLWEECILCLIGETLDSAKNFVCGIRIVDKSYKARQPMYRFEVWFKDDTNDEMKNKLKERFTAIIKNALSNIDHDTTTIPASSRDTNHTTSVEKFSMKIIENIEYRSHSY
jgi:translation initiation factor 4E